MTTRPARSRFLSPAKMREDLQFAAEGVKNDWAYYDDKRKEGVDPEAIARRLAARVDRRSDRVGFSGLLREFVAALHDGHAGLSIPGAPFPPLRRSPVRLRDAAEGIVIDAIALAARGAASIAVGDLVVAIDSQPVQRLIAERETRTFASTQAARRFIAVGALTRTPQTAQRFLIEKPDGRRMETVVGTSADDTPAEDSRAAWRRIAKDIGYLRIPTFRANDIAAWEADSRAGRLAEREALLASAKSSIDRAFVELAGTQALILDLRGNSGGTDLLGQHLTQHLLGPGSTYFFLQCRYSSDLAADPAFSRSYRQLKMQPPTEGWSPFTSYVPAPIRGVVPYSGRLVVLIDEGCFSATDNVLAALADLRPDVRFVGRPSGGGTGAPQELMTLPNSKAKLTFCTMRVLSPKKRLIEGAGTEPDVPVRWTRADVVAGRDPDLAAAQHLARRADWAHT